MASFSSELTTWAVAGQTKFRVSFDPNEIRGVHGMFGNALLINYDVSLLGPQSSGAALLTLEGWVLGQGEHPAIPGIRIPSQVCGQNQERLLVPITPEQVEIIEDRRAGNAVLLNLYLAGTALLPNPQVQVVTRVQRQQGQFEEALTPRMEVREVRPQGGAQLLRIERETWLMALEGLGAANRRLVELPAPPLPHQGPEWAACMRYLESALAHHRRGEYEQALQHCRKVVEGIATVLGTIWNVPHKPGPSFESWTKELNNRLAAAWPSEREAPKMLAALLAAAWTWTSPAAHYGVDMPVREESTFGLSATTDLLMFASQLVAAHPPSAGPAAGSTV